MRLFIDQDVYASTIALLLGAGHDVVRASDRGLARATDAEILAAATADLRVVVTRDLDFGRLLQADSAVAPVIILRFPASALNAVHAELLRVLALRKPEDLIGAIVIVEPGHHRVRRIARE